MPDSLYTSTFNLKESFMPKISLSSKDTVKGGFGAQEGTWEIGKASCIVYQFPPNSQTGEQTDPACMVRLELYKLDPNTLERIDDEPALEHLGFGRKNTLDILRPGKLAKPEDSEAEDMGAALGAEGNTVFGDPNHQPIKIYENCAWAKFAHSLADKGFKDELLKTGYLPYLEGTKFDVERLKTGFTPEGGDATRERTLLGVKKIHVFGYERKGKPAGKTPIPTRTGAGSKAPSPNSGSAAVIPPNGEIQTGTVVAADYDAIAKDGLDELAKQNKGREVKRALFQSSFMTFLMRRTKLDAEAKKNLVNETIRNDEWLASVTGEKGIGFDAGLGVLIFPAE